MNRATFITPAHRVWTWSRSHTEVCFQLCQHGGRGEIPRERLVAMKQIPGIFLHYDVDRIEQPYRSPSWTNGAPR